MRRRKLICLGCQVLMAGGAWAQGHDFAYSGESGPENWGASTLSGRPARLA